MLKNLCNKKDKKFKYSEYSLTTKEIVDNIHRDTGIDKKKIKYVISENNKKIIEELFKGNKVDLPKIGEIYFCKVKMKKPVNYKGKTHNNYHTFGYTVFLTWIKKSKLKNKTLFKIKLNRRLQYRLRDMLYEDSSLVYTYPDII